MKQLGRQKGLKAPRLLPILSEKTIPRRRPEADPPAGRSPCVSEQVTERFLISLSVFLLSDSRSRTV